MIRLIQRKLIIPRGDTGSFSVPAVKIVDNSIAVFSIIDTSTKTIVFSKEVPISGETITIEFAHEETVNLPTGAYVWDIKFYQNPQYMDEELVSGDEVDSYYAGFNLPSCEIRETGDRLLLSSDSPSTTLTPAQLNVLNAAVASTTQRAQETAENAQTATGNAQAAAASASAAQSSATEAATYAGNAAALAGDADESSKKAQAAQEGAEAAAEAAVSSAERSSSSATNASSYASQAHDSATSAHQSAQSATGSASHAQAYMQQSYESLETATQCAEWAAEDADRAEAAAASIHNMTAAAETLPEGRAASASYDSTSGVLTLGIPKGDTGATGPKGDPGNDYVLTAADKAEIAGMVNVPMTDVQVNGTSIVENGVANVPIATSNTPGVVTVKDGLFVGSTGHLYINRALDAQIKAAVDDYKPIVPKRQHISAFYGLATAAGDTTQSASENAVGAYTDEARKAIKKMLGIHDEWELIADVTVEEDSATFVINTDIEGNGFALSQMLVRVWLKPATTGQNDNVGTTSLGVNTTGDDANANSILVRYVGGGAATYMELKYELVCGVSIANTSAAASSPATAFLSRSTSAADNIAYYRGFRLKQQSASTSLIPSGSIVKIYGIRI